MALEWEADAGEAAQVVLDRRCAPAEFEEALSELCAIALAARAGKECLAIRSQSYDAVFGDGHVSFAELMRFMAETGPLAQDAEPPPTASPGVLRLPRNVGTEVTDVA